MRISDWSSDVCSSDLVVSTNPIAIAVPAAGRPPLILDLATSVASLGKILAATRAGQSIPEDWGLDSEGQIGRASCRARGSQYVYIPVGAVSLKTKNHA